MEIDTNYTQENLHHVRLGSVDKPKMVFYLGKPVQTMTICPNTSNTFGVQLQVEL